MKQILHLLVAVVLLSCMCVPASAYEDDLMEAVNIHGFISQGYLISGEYNYLTPNSKDGSFEYNEVGINFSKQLTDNLSMSVQLFSRDLGDVANNTVNLDYAYGDYRWRDWLGLRVGKIRVPIGLWNEVRDYDMLRPWVVLPQQRYNDLTRDAMVATNGVGIYGSLPAGAVGTFDYYLLTGIVNLDADQGYGKYMEGVLAGQAELDGDPEADNMIAGSLRWQSPLPGLMLGASAMKIGMLAHYNADYYGTPMQLDIDYDKLIIGYMAEYMWNDLSLWAEYFHEELNYTMSYRVNDTTGSYPETEKEPEGYYIGAAYRFADWFQLGAYYSFGYNDAKDKDGDAMVEMGFSDHKGYQQDIALTFRFDLNEYAVLKIEGHQMQGTNLVVVTDNEDSDFSEEDWYYGAAKLTVSF